MEPASVREGPTPSALHDTGGEEPLTLRNKYHVNFHVQADRLRNFAWSNMDYLCGESDYGALAFRLTEWLLGTDSTH